MIQRYAHKAIASILDPGRHQLVKLLLSLEIKGREQRPIHLFRDRIEGGEAEVLDADGGVRRAQAAELAAGTDDGQGVLRVTRQEEVKRREIVQHTP